MIIMDLKKFDTIKEALGYLNRQNCRFEHRNMLSNETIIAMANDIYYHNNS